MITDILIPLIAVGLAELGDKTQLSILLLSSKTKKHFSLLLGVMLAFFLVDGAAILIGSWVTKVIPLIWLKIFSGGVFLIFGVLILRSRKKERGSKLYSKNPFLSGFLLIFLTEWGDKTQIAAGLLATRYNALMVLTGTILALLFLSVIAIYLGKIISEKVDRKLIKNVAGIVFIVMGIVTLLL